MGKVRGPFLVKQSEFTKENKYIGNSKGIKIQGSNRSKMDKRQFILSKHDQTHEEETDTKQSSVISRAPPHKTTKGVLSMHHRSNTVSLKTHK